MNTPSRPVFSAGNVTPRSLGYSYQPGINIVSARPSVPIRTFGTAASPQPGTSPITPQRTGALTISGATPNSGIVSTIKNGLFA